MKSQMKFQKRLALITLIIAALTFVYALCFFSGNISDLMYYISKNWDGLYFYDGADTFLNLGQSFVTAMIVLGIIFIVITCTLFITDSNKRRNYYISNYIFIGITVAIALVVAVYGLIMLSMLISEFYAIDWDELWEFIETLKTGNNTYKDVSNSPVMFILGYILYLIVLADAVLLVLSTVWKVKLMKGEKELLEKSAAREVA